MLVRQICRLQFPMRLISTCKPRLVDNLSDNGYQDLEKNLTPEEVKDAILVPAPSEEFAPKPHLFDTQKTFTQLKYAGFTSRQSETIVTTLKALIEEVNKETENRSVPNSLAENETYLFNAATSEIKDETIGNQFNRETQYKSKLARLQRDVEILQHEAGEMTVHLRADMDMDINERKTMARTEENTLSYRLQEAENKINVQLSSELKSEIEQLRWQITRRGIIAIVFVSALILYTTKLLKELETSKPSSPQMEVRGGEYKVPMLNAGVFSQDPEDIVVEELNYEPVGGQDKHQQDEQRKNSAD